MMRRSAKRAGQRWEAKVIRNVRIGSRLAAAFTIYVTISIAIVWLMLFLMSGVESRLTESATGQWARVELAQGAASRAAESSTLVAMAFAAGDRAEAGRHLAALDDSQRRSLDELRALEALLGPDASSPAFRKVGEAGDALAAAVDRARRALAGESDGAARAEALAGAASARAAVADAWRDFIAREGAKIEEAAASGREGFAQVRALLAAILAVAAVLIVVAAWVLSRSITGPMAKAVALARRVAAGDVREAVDVEGRDEVS